VAVGSKATYPLDGPLSHQGQALLAEVGVWVKLCALACFLAEHHFVCFIAMVLLFLPSSKPSAKHSFYPLITPIV
jgi:hypothetical protein